MEAFTVEYKKGVQILTHLSGTVSVYVTSELKEHKQEIRSRIADLNQEVKELDKQIALCKGETVIAKVMNYFRREIVT